MCDAADVRIKFVRAYLYKRSARVEDRKKNKWYSSIKYEYKSSINNSLKFVRLFSASIRNLSATVSRLCKWDYSRHNPMLLHRFEQWRTPHAVLRSAMKWMLARQERERENQSIWIVYEFSNVQHAIITNKRPFRNHDILITPTTINNEMYGIFSIMPASSLIFHGYLELSINIFVFCTTDSRRVIPENQDKIYHRTPTPSRLALAFQIELAFYLIKVYLNLETSTDSVSMSMV